MEERKHIPCIENVDKRDVACGETTTPGTANFTSLGAGLRKYPRGRFSSLEFIGELGFELLYPSFIALER